MSIATAVISKKPTIRKSLTCFVLMGDFDWEMLRKKSEITKRAIVTTRAEIIADSNRSACARKCGFSLRLILSDPNRMIFIKQINTPVIIPMSLKDFPALAAFCRKLCKD